MSSESDTELLLFTRDHLRDILDEVKDELGCGELPLDWEAFSASLVTPMTENQVSVSDMQPLQVMPVEVVADRPPPAGREPSVPPPVTSVPAVDGWPGPHDFQVTVQQRCAAPAGRQPPYVFSAAAGKLYTDLLVAVPFCFTYAGVADPAALRIRALPVYCEAHHAQTPVRRCALHRDATHPSNAGQQHVRHVLRAQHPHASYTEENERCSVTVPLEPVEPATAHYAVLFVFSCMNTCVGGMNRRRLSVVFSLEERRSGRTLGRQVLEVKVCKCPHRDRRNDENRRAADPPSRRKRPRAATPPPPPPPPQPTTNSAGQLMVPADDLPMYQALMEAREALLRYRRALLAPPAAPEELSRRDTEPAAGDRQ